LQENKSVHQTIMYYYSVTGNMKTSKYLHSQRNNHHFH